MEQKSRWGAWESMGRRVNREEEGKGGGKQHNLVVKDQLFTIWIILGQFATLSLNYLWSKVELTESHRDTCGLNELIPKVLKTMSGVQRAFN